MTQRGLDFTKSHLKITRQYYAKYQAVSTVLEQAPELVDLIHRDVGRTLKSVNREGDRRGRPHAYTSEHVLRILICQVVEGDSLREIVVRIDDNNFLRRFVRIDDGPMMDYTTFSNLKNSIRNETWKAVNRRVAEYAVQSELVDGDKLRLDTTAVETNIHWPTDSTLLWDVYTFSDSRSGEFIKKSLGEFCGVLLTDGYPAYEKYAAQINDVVHAQCWSHTRRHFLKAEAIEPELTAQALEQIRDLYEEEGKIGARQLDTNKRLELRGKHCKSIVDQFFKCVKTTLEQNALLPSSPFTAAADYALFREDALRVFLEYPDVPIDTNHLEREIRPVALGRKNWVFCWTEIGAECVGIFQSLIATCRLQEIDPYTYLVDVLQRVEDHPASDAAALTPRLWKERFADDPRRSRVDRVVNNAVS